MAASEPMATTFAVDAAKQASNALKGMNPADVTAIWVYRAKLADGQPTEGASCPSNCVKFTLTTAGQPTGGTGTWTSRNACAATPPETVGVMVEYRHRSLTGILFNNRVVREVTAMQLEPVAATPCVSS
jgi:hypothetical protein